jgi:hypothetical protein
VRQLDDNAGAMLLLSARHYVEKAHACAAGLTRVG